jgi:hypothetical protein
LAILTKGSKVSNQIIIFDNAPKSERQILCELKRLEGQLVNAGLMPDD